MADHNNNHEGIKPGLADYIGYSCYFFAVASLGGLAYWGYEVWVDEFEFRWSIFVGFIVMALVGFVCGLLIFRKKTG